jgi:hypothetical protein
MSKKYPLRKKRPYIERVWHGSTCTAPSPGGPEHQKEGVTALDLLFSIQKRFSHEEHWVQLLGLQWQLRAAPPAQCQSSRRAARAGGAQEGLSTQQTSSAPIKYTLVSSSLAVAVVPVRSSSSPYGIHYTTV